MYPSAGVVGQFQNVTTYEGDITIRNNATFLIENCQFNLTGKLIIRDTAEVIFRNATFISNWNTSEVPEKVGANPWRTRHVIVENQAKLTVLDSDLIFSATYPWHGEYHGCLLLYDQATANITESKVTYANGPGDFMYVYNDSKLWIRDVMISTNAPENVYGYEYPKSGLVTFGRSEVEVQNSTFDEICIMENCSVIFCNLNAGSFTIYDNSGVNIIDSTISQVDVWGKPNSNVWLTDTTLETLVAHPNSKVWLYNSSVKEIHVSEKANVWVVWDLPLLGQVAVPYAWAPYIFPVIALVIASIVIVAVFFLIRRKRVLKNKLRQVALAPMNKTE
jgi:hypothetical protein